MTDVVLIDTSCWTQALRKDGDPVIRERVGQLLRENRAAWCDIVRLELWAGVRADERDSLKRLEASLPRLPIDDAVWSLACLTTNAARDRAFTAPASDFLIWACAKRHLVSLDHADKHFLRIAELV